MCILYMCGVCVRLSGVCDSGVSIGVVRGFV